MKKIVFQILIIFLPWNIRRSLLCYFFKYKIPKSAFIGKSIILADKLKMDENSAIGNLTFCKNIGFLNLGINARIGSLNYITGFPQNNKDFFSHRTDRKCELFVGNHSAITSRHFIDCTAGVYFGNYTTFAGIRSQILTHSIDVVNNIQDCKPVKFGSYCFIGTGITALAGSNLPDYAILGANSLLNKVFSKENTLYGGVPAKEISSLDNDKLKYFHRTSGFVY